MLSPLSDVSGRIRHIFFALPAYQVDFISPILSCMRGIRQALGSEVRCTVMHHPAQEAAIQDALRDLGPLDVITWQHGFVLRLRDTRSEFERGTLRVSSMALPDFTNWVQDAFLVSSDSDGQPGITVSPKVKREFGGWDDEVARQLAEHLGWACGQLPMGVEAGNILVDDHTILIGSDVPADAIEADWQRLHADLSRDHRSVQVCVPNQHQPIFHLDLYVTLAGPHVNTGQPLALVGQTESDDELGVGLNAVADHLGTLGFSIERLPLRQFTNAFMNRPGHYTYNNCLVEVWPTQNGGYHRQVTLPAYGSSGDEWLAELDRKAERVWAGLGFEVNFARGEFAKVAELYGSVRCMTKVLERSDTM